MNTPHIKPPKIWVNAEFQRLLWLNLSWGMIAGVAIIYALFAFAKDEYRAWHNHLASIGGIGLMLSAIAGFVLVERSLKNDIAANAFDQLRMSALSPWQMTYSRIIAAPTVAWAGFVIGYLLLWLSFFWITANLKRLAKSCVRCWLCRLPRGHLPARWLPMRCSLGAAIGNIRAR